MQLNRFSDIGLRVLLYLTHQDRVTIVTIHEIAEQFSVPHSHLVKVVNRLGKLGWIDTVRGRNGGLRLAADPAALRLGKVLRALEETTQLIDCENLQCALRGRCILKAALDAGLKAFYDKMDEYTLADVSASHTGMAIATMHHTFLASRSLPPQEFGHTVGGG